MIAENEASARVLLNDELLFCGLKMDDEKPFTLVEVGLSVAQAIVLQDGDY